MRVQRPALLLVAPALLVAAALTGCSGNSRPPPRSPPGHQRGDQPGGHPPTAPAPAPAAAAEDHDETLHDDLPAELPEFPADVAAPEQGGRYTAVVLATGSSAELQDDVDRARVLGLHPGVSDAGCLDGLTDVVPVADGDLVATVLFDDAATARSFTDASRPGLPHRRGRRRRDGLLPGLGQRRAARARTPPGRRAGCRR